MAEHTHVGMDGHLQDGWKRRGIKVPDDVASGGRTVKDLSELYLFEDEAVIREFVEENQLHDVLVEAAYEIRKVFGGQAKMQLSMVDDLELGTSTVIAYVLTDLSVEEALKKVRQIDRGWFIYHPERLTGRFNFDVTWQF